MAAEVSFWMQTAPSLIAAVAGISGVMLGSWSTARREAKRDLKSETVDRAYLSTHLSIALEKFVDGCNAVANDDGCDEYGQPASSDGRYLPTCPYPVFNPTEIDGNWKSLSSDILDRVLLIPYQTDQSISMVRSYSFDEDPPYYEGHFLSRRYYFSKLGLDVVLLIDDLRSRANLPKMKRDENEFSNVNNLQAVYDKTKTEMT